MKTIPIRGLSNEEREAEMVQDYWGVIEEQGGMEAPIGPTLLAIAQKALSDEERLITFVAHATKRGEALFKIREQIRRGDHCRSSSGCIPAYKLK